MATSLRGASLLLLPAAVRREEDHRRVFPQRRRCGAWQPAAAAYRGAVFAFLPAREPLPSSAGDDPRWRQMLLASAAFAAFATTQPWVRVQFARLWGDHLGPPGWHTSAGFTCFCTCALVAILALSETSARSSRQAVRPASLLLVAVCAIALSFEWWDGPGHLRGVSANWTYAFWLLGASVPSLLWACTRRCAGMRARPATGSM